MQTTLDSRTRTRYLSPPTAGTEGHLAPTRGPDQIVLPSSPVRFLEREVHWIGTQDEDDHGPPSSSSSSRALWLDTPVERGRTPVSTSSHHRSTSVPSKPLKSALVVGSPPTSPGGRRKKKVDFFDQAALKRSETAPVLVLSSAVKEDPGHVLALGNGGELEKELSWASGDVNSQAQNVLMTMFGVNELDAPDATVSSSTRAGERFSDPGLEIDEEYLSVLPPARDIMTGFARMDVYTVNREGSPVDDSTENIQDHRLLMLRSTTIDGLDPSPMMIDQPSPDLLSPGMGEDSLSGTNYHDSETTLQAPQGHEQEVLETYHRMHEMEKRRFSVQELEELKVWSASPEELGPGEIESDDAGSEARSESLTGDSIVSSICTSGRVEMEAEDEVGDSRPPAVPSPLPFQSLRATRSPNQSSRRAMSDSEASVLASKMQCEKLRHLSSMSDFEYHLPFHNIKADLAQCALTAVSVRTADSARPSIVSEPRPFRTAQTVCSPESMYQMLWEEPTDASDIVRVMEDEVERRAAIPEAGRLFAHISPAPLPLDQVETKLAAWSWAREVERDDEYPRWIPLLAVNRRASSEVTEGPPAPPNTARGSLAYSALHSNLHSPVPEEVDDEEDIPHADADDEDDPPLLEVKYKYKLTLSGPQTVDYMSLPKAAPHSLPVSPLGTQYQHPPSGRHDNLLRHLPSHVAEGEHFRLHRDSVELSRRQLSGEAKMNPNLMKTSDSFLLTRSRYPGGHQPHLKSGLTVGLSGGPAGWHRIGGLPTISEAKMHGLEVKKGASSVEVAGMRHPDEHVGCAIYEVERPRWFEGRYRSGPFSSKPWNGT